MLPQALINDEVRARVTYPGVILLGAWFAIAELAGGRWQSLMVHEERSPTAARASLITYLRHTAPDWETPGLDVCAAYSEAAGKMEFGPLPDVTAAGGTCQPE